MGVRNRHHIRTFLEDHQMQRNLFCGLTLSFNFVSIQVKAYNVIWGGLTRADFCVHQDMVAIRRSDTEVAKLIHDAFSIRDPACGNQGLGEFPNGIHDNSFSMLKR
jgi:hypothetical protein